MESAEKLYEAVVAAPNDRALRGQYGAALRAVGDPRGELAALQLLDERTPAEEARLAELLTLHGAAWFGDGARPGWQWHDGADFLHWRFPDLAPDFGPRLCDHDRWRVRDGAPEAATLPAEELLGAGTRLRARAPLRELHIYSYRTAAAETFHQGELNKARDLGMSSAMLSHLEEQLAAVRARPDITDLLSSPALRGLGTLGLQALGVDDAAVERLAEATALEGLGGLHLVLSGACGARSTRALSRSVPLRHLRSLSLVCNPFDAAMTKVNDEACAALAECPALRRLRLEGCPVGPRGVEALLSRDAAPSLEELAVGAWEEDGPTSQMLKAIGLAERAPALRRLELRQDSLEWDHPVPDPHELSALLARLDQLEHLAVEGDRSEFGRALAGALAEAAPPSLRSLSLAGTDELGDAEAAALLTSPRLAGLQALDLSRTNAGTRALEALGQAPFCPRLRSLRLPRLGPSFTPATWMAEVCPILASLPFEDLLHLELELGGWSGDLDPPPIGAAEAGALASSPHLAALTFLGGVVCTPEAVGVLRDRWGPRLVIFSMGGP